MVSVIFESGSRIVSIIEKNSTFLAVARDRSIGAMDLAEAETFLVMV